jgi:hypothetical protein
MPDVPAEPEYEKEAERRFDDTLGRLLGANPKPHKDRLARRPKVLDNESLS